MKVRWLTFTAVGTIGFIVQLAALWLLTNHLHFHYLAGTLVATELAVLLNFFCHQWWTWSDRQPDGQEALRRFWRFHVANGAISLAGGALIMPLLIEMGHVHYLLANATTVGVCSVANFVAADRVVFRRGTRLWGSTPAFLLVLALVPSSTPVEAADLRADTLDAFNRYVRVTESRMDGELHGKVAFLWVDRLPEAERLEAYTRLKRGETVVSRLVTQDAGREIDSPHGLIHHWIGTSFGPVATVDRTVALMQSYDRYQEIYSPSVRQSHTISRQGETFKVYLQLFMKKVIGVVLNTEYDIRYTRLSSTRAHVRSYSTRIAEVHDSGTANEKEMPVGQDSGYLWRFDNYCSLEERAEGTFIQCESVSLSRAIPTGLGWLVGPFVTSIPRESLEFTLGSIRRALSYSGK
jgi:putative flippase GtrA